MFLEGIARLKEKAKRRKGRGHGTELMSTRDDIGHYESMNVVEEDDNEPGPQRCKNILLYFLLIIIFYYITALLISYYSFYFFIIL